MCAVKSQLRVSQSVHRGKELNHSVIASVANEVQNHARKITAYAEVVQPSYPRTTQPSLAPAPARLAAVRRTREAPGRRDRPAPCVSPLIRTCLSSCARRHVTTDARLTRRGQLQ